MTIIGNTDLVSGAAQIASQMYHEHVAFNLACVATQNQMRVNFKSTLMISSFAR